MKEKIKKFFKKIEVSVEWFCNKRASTTCFIDKCCGMDWKKCSDDHDNLYRLKQVSRLRADLYHFYCVKSNANVVLAGFFFITLRLFGWVRYNKVI